MTDSHPTELSRPEAGSFWRRHFGALLCVSMLLLGVDALRREVGKAAPRPHAGQGSPPSQWKLGMPVLEPLRVSLEHIGALVPEGSLVAVHAPELAPPELFFLSMWCSYYLPHNSVLRLEVIGERHRTGRGSYALLWPPDASAPGFGEEVYSDDSVTLRRRVSVDAGEGASR